MIVTGDFNMQPMDTVLKCLMDINGFINLIRNKTCFKGKGSSLDLILTKRKYSFKNSSLCEIGLNDHHHHLIYTNSKKLHQNLKSKT